jgi:hypothetical protein
LVFDLSEDRLNIEFESFLKHGVCLVDAHNLKIIEQNCLFLHQIDQPPRSGYDDGGSSL